ncbi:hypothetical protein [Aequorivita viscosa]|uniref:Uncharacterized protein n=1 Tax=Aequorivita viscosa TaxID=797419 RepID=A0A1M6KKK3_9FLAO|nr:hypothetical protein [Aequorivita viscosa]SDX19263.1 hypothetical protein SAMN05216556_1206 [Aequorivita viscosa]SHJ59507.1 hypothetical protein SAMN04487908_12066 [Aequorivita viscosa]
MSVKASQKAFISHYIKLDFFNNSNLKTDIQNRISNESEINFQKALENIQGDNKETKGVPFSELALLAMAYFFERIFPENVPLKDSDYCINSVKGYFDACNNTPYTPIYEIDTTYHKLRDTALFRACYLIIQSAWFFNSEHFGRHQYLEYASHYIRTGEQLPVNKYQYDKGDLFRKYARIDEKRNTKHHPKGEPAFKFVEQWYYYILYLVCKELEIPTNHFKTTLKDFREYNPLTKCPKILRAETPFKVIECDIKSAFPSFLDLQTGSRIKDEVYTNLMERKNINRSDAKVLFNSHLNSGKYKTKEQIKNFLIECGYTATPANEITKYTNGKIKFIVHMSELEQCAIQDFIETNTLKNAVRLHDSVLFIDSGMKDLNLKAENGLIEFGMSVLKKPVFSNSFGYSNKSLRFAYISSVPPATNEDFKNLIRKQVLTRPKVKGEANGFKFYTEKYEYISASFDLNQKYSFEEFIFNCREMVSTLNYLNGKPISKTLLYLILSHIRQNSNVIFNLRFLYRELLKQRTRIDDVITRQRDFELTESLTFKRKIDFLNALNKARGEVNKKVRLKHLFRTLEKRVSKQDFSFIDYKMKGKAKTNELAKTIMLRINVLITGKIRNTYAQNANTNPLYSIIYKEGTNYRFEHHKKANKHRLIQRKIQAYEKELLRVNRLINNRETVIQYLFILAELTGLEIDQSIKANPETIQKEKAFLIQQITGAEYKSTQQAEKAFNSLFVPKPPKEIESHIPTLKDFCTSLKHSAFNIEIEQAYSRGSQFFDEYLRFHKLNETPKTVKALKPKTIDFPQLDFDDWK